MHALVLPGKEPEVMLALDTLPLGAKVSWTLPLPEAPLQADTLLEAAVSASFAAALLNGKPTTAPLGLAALLTAFFVTRGFALALVGGGGAALALGSGASAAGVGSLPGAADS